MIITNKNYIVPIIINGTELITGITKAKLMSYRLSNVTDKLLNVTVLHSRSAPTNEAITVRKWMDKATQDFEHLETKALEFLSSRFPTQRTSRKKRAYINIIGDLSKKVFGTATEDDINEIHENLENIKDMSEEQRRQINVHTEILNNSIRDISRVQAAMQGLEASTDMLKNIMGEQQNDITIIAAMTEQLSIESVLQLALTELSNDFRDLQYGIDKLFNLYPAHDIISDQLLSDLLTSASKARGGLIFPTTAEFLSIYRDFCTIIPKQTEFNGKITFYLSIPLMDELSNPYDLFKIHSIPISTNANITSFIQYSNVEPYLAISENRHYFTTLKNIDQCKKREDLLICKHKTPIYKDTTDNCEFRTFINKESKLCKEVILQNFQPIFIPFNHFYIYSTPHSLSLTVVCPDRRFTTKTNLTGMLEAESTCSIHSELFTIPATSSIYSRDTAKVKFTYDMVYASAHITHITKSAEHIINELQKVGEVTSTSFTAPIELQMARTKLEILKKTEAKPWHHYISTHGISITTTLFIIAIAICIWKCYSATNICRLCIGAAEPTPGGEDYVRQLAASYSKRAGTQLSQQNIRDILQAIDDIAH